MSDSGYWWREWRTLVGRKRKLGLDLVLGLKSKGVEGGRCRYERDPGVREMVLIIVGRLGGRVSGDDLAQRQTENLRGFVTKSVKHFVFLHLQGKCESCAQLTNRRTDQVNVIGERLELAMDAIDFFTFCAPPLVPAAFPSLPQLSNPPS